MEGRERSYFTFLLSSSSGHSFFSCASAVRLLTPDSPCQKQLAEDFSLKWAHCFPYRPLSSPSSQGSGSLPKQYLLWCVVGMVVGATFPTSPLSWYPRTGGCGRLSTPTSISSLIGDGGTCRQRK